MTTSVGFPSPALREVTDEHCAFCGEPFVRKRRQGAPQKFCCADHRDAFHSLARAYGELQLSSGRLTVEDMKNEIAAVHGCDGAAHDGSVREPAIGMEATEDGDGSEDV